MKNRKAMKLGAESEFPIPENWVNELTSPGIVICSRVQVSRNLDGIPFPDRLTPEARRKVRDMIFSKIESRGNVQWSLCNWEDPFDFQHEIFRQHNYVTPLMEQREGGAGVMFFYSLSKKGGRRSLFRSRTSSYDPHVLINDEDHLEFRRVTKGGDLAGAYESVMEMEAALDGNVVEYAYDSTFGYLTRCPSKLGTGLRVGMMLQLVGLFLTGELPKVLQGLERLGLEARGVGDEGSTEAPGCLYQITNTETLGESELEILNRMSEILHNVAQQEDWARIRLCESQPVVLSDFLSRSIAIGQSARLLSRDEAISLYYAMRFGFEMGMLVRDGYRGVYKMDPAYVDPLHEEPFFDNGKFSEMDKASSRAIRTREFFMGWLVR